MDLQLRGKRVLVTGASRGIGEGVAEAFAEQGSDVLLVARSADRLEALARRLVKVYGVVADTLSLDLADPAAGARLLEAGAVDILVNNAGDIPGGSIGDLTPEAWQAGWALKVFGYVDLCRRFLPLMQEVGHGVIINVIGASANYLDSAYVAGTTGNAALVALTRTLGARSLDNGVRVLGVNPGPVATDRIMRLLRQRGGVMPDFPLGRPASVREVADLIMFLASPRSAYTSGVVVDIDGGLSARHGS